MPQFIYAYEPGRKIRNTLMGEARHGRAWFLPVKDHISQPPPPILYSPSTASSIDSKNAEIHDILIKSFNRECMNNKCTLTGQPVKEDPQNELYLHTELCDVRRYKHLTDGYQHIEQTHLLKVAHLNSSYLVNLYHAFGDEQYIYALMEFCAGGELYQHIVANKSFYTLKNAKIFFVQLLCGLSAMHSLRIAHRDLSLENLLLTSDLHLRIVDFGLAVKYQPEKQSNKQSIKQTYPRSIKELTHGAFIDDGIAVGKLQYMSPEMYSWGRYDPFANDIWACGVILWGMMYHHFPFVAPHSSDARFVAICRYGINVVLCQSHDTPLDQTGLELFTHIFCPEEKRWTVEECLSSAFLRDTWKEHEMKRGSVNQSNNHSFNLLFHQSHNLSRNSSSNSSTSIDYSQTINSYDTNRPQTSHQSAPATFNQTNRQTINQSNNQSINSHIFNQTNNPYGAQEYQSTTRSQQITHSINQSVDPFSLDGTNAVRSINHINQSNSLYPDPTDPYDFTKPIPPPIKL